TRVSGTFGITTLRKRHVSVRGNRVRLCFVGKGRTEVRTSLVDDELASAIRTLNEYVKANLGPEFSAKDFRTWGGTLLAAIAFAERGLDGKAAVTAVM